MSKNELTRIKYSTYIEKQIADAIRDFAHDKKVSAGYVIEAAIRKCIPEKYFPASGT
jgi:hypothetical protein